MVWERWRKEEDGQQRREVGRVERLELPVSLRCVVLYCSRSVEVESRRSVTICNSSLPYLGR